MNLDENRNSSSKLSHRQIIRAKKRLEKNVKLLAKRKLKKLQTDESKILHEQEESKSATEESDLEADLKLERNLVGLKNVKPKTKGFSDDNKLWLRPKEKSGKKHIQSVSILVIIILSCQLLIFALSLVRKS